MSASLNVVRIAAVCCAITSCAAIFRRSGERRLRVTRPVSCGAMFSEMTASDSFAAATAAAGVSATGAGAATGTGTASGFAAFFAGLVSGDFASAGFASAVFSAAAFAGAAAPASMVATTSPIFTSAPACALMRNVPAASAVISVETLSVSRVSSASPLLTASPSFFNHAEIMPLVTDSPTAGIFTSRLIVVALDWILKMPSNRGACHTSNARRTSCACSRSLTFFEPTAVLAPSSRPA